MSDKLIEKSTVVILESETIEKKEPIEPIERLNFSIKAQVGDSQFDSKDE